MSLPSTDSELRDRVRSETGYDDNADELPQADLDNIIETSKSKLSLETGTSESSLYNTKGLQLALLAYTNLRAKATMENIPLSSYDIGGESIEMRDVDPEDSHQIQMWMEDVSDGLDAADQGSGSRQMVNTSSYIGEKTDIQ
jgi:hypothetical protein